MKGFIRVAAKVKKKKNPFYTLLVGVGVLFAITATAYGVMTVTYLRASEERDPTENHHPLFQFLDANGFDVMLAELGLLGVLTFAAIAYDEIHDPDGTRTQKPSDVEEDGDANEQEVVEGDTDETPGSDAKKEPGR